MDWSKFFTPDVGAIGILVTVIFLILWGMLVPKSTLNSMLQVKDQQIDMYKTAYETSMDAVRIRDEQIGQLMDMARTTERVIESLPQAASERRGRDPMDAEDPR